MPRIENTEDEAYPVYFVETSMELIHDFAPSATTTTFDSSITVEITDAEKIMLDTAERNWTKAQQFLAAKYEEAEEVDEAAFRRTEKSLREARQFDKNAKTTRRSPKCASNYSKKQSNKPSLN